MGRVVEQTFFQRGMALSEWSETGLVITTKKTSTVVISHMELIAGK